MERIVFLSVFMSGLSLIRLGKAAEHQIQNLTECSVADLQTYQYIHCFDSNYAPIGIVMLDKTLVPEKTKCFVSCNHKRVLSTWLSCENGTWIGSLMNCKELENTKQRHRRVKRWWLGGGGGGDNTPPEITCPSSKTVFANYQGRAYVYYNLPLALDGNKPDGVTMQRTTGISSGSFAGIGSHLICYKAKDKSGNESKQCCFHVYVNHCTSITRCIRVHCSTYTDQACSLCNSGYHPSGQICAPTCVIPHCQHNRYVCVNDTLGNCEKCVDDGIIWKRINNNTSCGAICSVMNRRACWPGSCHTSGLGRDCTCDAGFVTKTNSDGTVAHCLLAKKPIIDTCRSSLKFEGGEIVQSPTTGSTSCSAQQDVYINKNPKNALFGFEGSFSVNVTSPKPDYIKAESWNYGLLSGRFVVVHKQLNGLEVTINSSTFEHLNKTNLKQLHTEEKNLPVSEIRSLSNGDAICLRFIAVATGFFRTVDKRNKNPTISPIIYNGETLSSRDVCFLFDSFPPDHCLNSKTCQMEPIQIQSRITKNNVITISTSGWFDPNTVGKETYNSSGIKIFDISIYKVPHSENMLTPDTSAVLKNESPLPLNFEVQLNETGLYEILLEVVDKAGEGGNIRSARRFILFDNTSTILLNENKPLLVTTAHIQNGKYWQTEKKEICVNWTDRFYNDYHKKNNLLLPIKKSAQFSGVFEQLNGSLSINGTENVNGIVKFEYMYMINNQTVNTKREVSYLNEHVCRNIPIKDGDKVNFTILAVDIMGNNLEDSVFVLIDTSVPDIDNIWLRRNKYGEVYVHNSRELSKMKLHFNAYDTESGLKTIHWFLGLKDGGSQLGNGTIAVNILTVGTTCGNNSNNCYCPNHGSCESRNYSLDLSKIISEAQHNRDYYFTIVATNNAGLRSVQHLDVLVDESPPVNGTVKEFEDLSEESESDFTSDGKVKVKWNGFIDHESGISHYEIFLGRNCFRNLSYLLHSESNDLSIIERRTSTEPFEWFSLPDMGHYIFTVISFNNALEPSAASCSDGIVYEKSPDLLANVSSKSFNAEEGIVCFDGTSWLITENMKRIKLGSHQNCLNKCSNISFPSFLRHLPEDTSTEINDPEYADGICLRLDSFDNRLIFISNEYWEMSWNIKELNKVLEFEIGIGSNPTSLYYPDIKPYTVTFSQTKYRFIKEGLGNQEKHFVFLKTKFKSGEDNILTIGPLIKDISPPNVHWDIRVLVKGSYLFIGWGNDSIFDGEKQKRFKEIFFRIGTLKEYATPLVQYYETNNLSEECPFQSVIGCISYPINRIRYNELENNIFVELHVFNHIGLSTKLRSKYFNLPSKISPGNGIIFDVDPENSSNKDIKDVDFQQSSSKLCLIWKGLDQYQNVSVSVGLGLSPNSTDVMPFTKISRHQHCFQNLSLPPFKRYYTVMQASCSGGNSFAWSDGVVPINITDLNANLKLFNGEECLEENVLMPVKFKIHNNESILYYTNLSVLDDYTLFIQKITKRNENILIKRVVGLRITGHARTNIFTILEMKATNSSGSIGFGGISLNSYNISLRKCQFNRQYVLSKNELSFNWRMDWENDITPTHFEISMAKFTKDKLTVIQTTRTEKQTLTFRNITLDTKEKYCGVLKACYANICSKPVVGFPIRFVPLVVKMNTTATINYDDAGNHKINVLVEHEDTVINSSLTRWTLSEDAEGKGIICDWNFFENNYDKKVMEATVPLLFTDVPPRYVCVQRAFNSWISPLQCTLINNSFQHRNVEIDVFIVGADNPNLQKMKEVSHSRNLGANILMFEEGRLLYTTSGAKITGIIVGNEGKLFEVYLMKISSVPMNKDECNSNKNCLHFVQVKDGFVSFPSLHLKHNDEIFICIRSTNDTFVNSESKTNLQNEIFERCSKKLKINDMPPSSTKINVRNSKNGYLSVTSFLDANWTIPDLNVPLLEYKYCIGSYPRLDDMLPFLSSYEVNKASVYDVAFKHGSSYFLTVIVVDRSGLESTSTSEAFTIDITPPIPGKFFVGYEQINDKTIVGNNIPVIVEGFEDPESGIDMINVRIAGINTDYVSNTIVERGLYKIKLPQDLKDGYEYKAIIQVSNRAGLSTEIESNSFVVDNSPPIHGYVFDGKEIRKDFDYQSYSHSISANWDHFYDPHSDIAFYKVGLGTSQHVANVYEFTNVGLKKDFTWKGEFDVGVKLFVLLEACNGVYMCSSAHSDGIIIDKTPPVPGLVTIGRSTHDSFIPDKSSLALQWVGFEDTESDIRYFEWCLGSFRYSCDIHDRENVLLATRIFKSNLELPINAPIYATVFAFNNAGMSSNATSKKSSVDTTPPVIIERPTFLALDALEENVNYQYDNSILKLKWKFDENESSIVDIHIVIKNTRLGEDVSDIIVRDNSDDTIITLSEDTRLRNGDSVVGIVSACNMARLCTTISTQSLIVDSSRPTQGGLSYPITWSLNKNSYEILVNWYGFSDDESGISHYYLTVGKTYSDSKLSGGAIQIDGNRTNISIPVNATIFNLNEAALITIWAVNRARLTSLPSKVTVIADQYNNSSVSGKFYVQRHSCSIHYCNNDCTCSVVGKKCSPASHELIKCLSTSENISTLDEKIIITNLNPNSNILSSISCIGISFENMNLTEFNLVHRFEWSVGILNELPGIGFYSKDEYPWRDIGLRMSDIECLAPHRNLENGAIYMVYVRIWISTNNYVIRHSKHIKVDANAPYVKMGKFISTYPENMPKKQNVRFINEKNSSICAKWDSVFFDREGNISGYYLMVGSQSKADDVFRTTFIGLQSKFCLRTTNLTVGVNYVFSVTAEDKAGMRKTLESFPFMIDNIPPVSGTVYNTKYFRDRLYTSSSSSLSISWTGFQDDGSHLMNYEYRVREGNESGEAIAIFHSLGFQNSLVIENITLAHGRSYLIDVRAVDAAGNVGEISTSHPVIVDTTPPRGFYCKETTEEHVNISVQHDVAQFILDLKPDVNLILKFTFKEEQPNELLLNIFDKPEFLYFNQLYGEGLQAEYQHISLHSREERVTLRSNGTNFDHLNVSAVYCKMHAGSGPDAIEIKQLQTSVFRVITRSFDLESGIKNVSIDIGTTEFGQQILSDVIINSPDKIISVSIPHNTTIFASAKVVNGAGLKEYFTSKSLVVDNTPPVVEKFKVHLKDSSNNGTNARLIGSFKTYDGESGVKRCLFSIGSSPLSENLQSWTPLEMSTENVEFISTEIDITNGMEVLCKIKCTNTIGLSLEVTADPVKVTLLPPNGKRASIAVVPDGCFNNALPISSDKKSIILRWKGFVDYDPIQKFHFRVTSDQGTLVPWISTQERDYGYVDKLNLSDGVTYRAEVEAFNSLSNGSNVLQEFTTETRQSDITEKIPTLSRQGDIITIDWSGLFYSYGLNSTFVVNVGSGRYFSDLLHSLKTTKTNVEIEIPGDEKIYSVFLSIRANLCTGQSSLYYNALPLE